MNTCLVRPASASFALGILLSAAILVASAQTNVNLTMSETLYPLLIDQVMTNRTSFYIYQDADSGFNHGSPSGLFGVSNKISFESACIDTPEIADGCSSDVHHVDHQRMTVMRISFAALLPGEFAGITFEEPAHWGERRMGTGYDLRGSTHVVFDIRSPTPGGIRVQFGVEDGVTDFIHIPQGKKYTTMSIPLSEFRPAPDLSDAHRLFTVTTNALHASRGGKLLLDNIRFEPVPMSQQRALGFPLSTQTFGVQPLRYPVPGRVPIPPDQVLRNVTTTYESALALLGLLASPTEPALGAARLIADTFHYALRHDNSGATLPRGSDGSIGLHDAYQSGDIALLNDQQRGVGRRGEARLAGFSASHALCGPSRFCYVLDGATGGNNAFAILALGAAYQQFEDERYLDDARTIGNWIAEQLTDASQAGFGGYYLGYPSVGTASKARFRMSKSVENNAAIFAAFTMLASLEKQLGHATKAATWLARARVAGDFVMAMFDAEAGCFAAGTVPHGVLPEAGILPDGPQKGNDVINMYLFLDAQIAPILSLASVSLYQDQIDWRRPVQCGLNHFSQGITSGGQVFLGLNIVQQPLDGPHGIAWEFVNQAIVAMLLVDTLYQETNFNQVANFYLNELQRTMTGIAGNRWGCVASTLETGDKLLPGKQCLSTPSQCIPERVGMAATMWAIFAAGNINPLSSDISN